ncbi:MAG: hypothetical protein ABTR92_03175 [Candidatus Accumulibacter phosphatis]|uniref:hypothetical protein n=1 Tax=Candidatus Accumulibacter sp. ACC012 TaxID=2823332 RepID=UPI0025C01633|nr:hypothetical protein [Candidatus Accumulibacter sp. ACC012]
MSEDLTRRQFATEVLGPIFYAYCHRLWLFQMGTDKASTVALFAARGGLRLLALYDRFLAIQRVSSPVRCHPFMISRLAAAKGCYCSAPEVVREQVVRIFRAQTIGTLAGALIPSGTKPPIQLMPGEVSDKLMGAPVSTETFDALVNSDSEYGRWLRQHLEEQGDLLRDYVLELAGTNSRILLCDTGLYGCTQAMLAAANSELDWTGVYFGKANYTGEFARHHLDAFGLVFGRDHPSLFVPATAFLRYWHICEMPMEPPLPSVAYYFRGHEGQTLCNIEARSLKSVVETPGNPYYEGICDFFDAHVEPQPATEINRDFRLATKRLQRLIYLPAEKDVHAMTVGSRCPDFGRQGEIPAMVAVTPKTTTAKKVFLVRDALWQEGQTRLAFPIIGGLLNVVRWCLRLAADVARLPLAAVRR